MSSEKEDLICKIQKITKAFWDTHNQPLLLSDLPRKLIEEGIDNYKEIAEGNMKKFVSSSMSSDNYKLIVHPHQKAKIGIIPATESYSYDVSFEPRDKKTNYRDCNISEKSAILFLRSLSKLSDEEIDSIVIPTKVLAKLFSK